MNLPYFPPKGTRFQWNPPGLVHLPWTVWPKDSIISAKLTVCGLDDAKFKWCVNVWEIPVSNDLMDMTHSGICTTGLEACLAAEARYERIISEYVEPWMIKAHENGWRIPNRRYKF